MAISVVGDFFSQHWVAVVWTFTTQYVWSAFIGALEAPTAQSSSLYKFFFKFANRLAGNLSRANNTAVESSPNWDPAVTHEIKMRNGKP